MMWRKKEERKEKNKEERLVSVRWNGEAWPAVRSGKN